MVVEEIAIGLAEQEMQKEAEKKREKEEKKESSNEMQHPKEKDGISVGQRFDYIKNNGDQEEVVVQQINVFEENGVEKTTYTINKINNPIGGGWAVSKDRLVPTEPESSGGDSGGSDKGGGSSGGDSGDSNGDSGGDVKPPRKTSVGWIQPLIALVVTLLLLIFLKLTGVIGNVATWIVLLIIIGVNIVLAKFTEKLEMKYREEQEKRKNLGMKSLFSFDLETIIAVSLIIVFFGFFEDALTSTIIGVNELFIFLVFTLAFFFRYHIANFLRLIYHKTFQKLSQKAKGAKSGVWHKILNFFHKGIILTILKLVLSWAITYIVVYRWFQEPLLGFIIITLILALVIWQEWGVIAFLPFIIYVGGILWGFKTEGLILPYLIIIGCVKLFFDFVHAMKKSGVKINSKIVGITLIIIIIGLATFFAFDFARNSGVFENTTTSDIIESTNKWNIIQNFKTFYQSNFALISQDTIETEVNKNDYTYLVFSDVFSQNNVEMYNSNEIIADISIDSTSEIKEYNATISCKLYDSSNKFLSDGYIYPQNEIVLSFIPQTIRCVIPGESLTKVGNYKVKLFVNVKNMTTTTIVSNEILDGEYLTNKLREIALKNNLRFSTDEEYLKMIAFAFPHLIAEKPISITTDGPITLALKSGNMPINSYPYQNSNNNLKVGVMNNDDGELSRIEYLKIYLPEDYEFTATNSDDTSQTVQLGTKNVVGNYNMYELKDESKKSLVSAIAAIKSSTASSYGSSNLLGTSNGIIKTFFYEAISEKLQPNKYLETQKNFIAEIKYDYQSEKEILFSVSYDPIFASFANVYAGEKYSSASWPIEPALEADSIGTGWITSYYSLRDLQGIIGTASNYHGGIDIGGAKGTTIKSISEGTVVLADPSTKRVAVVTNDKKIRIGYSHIVPSVNKGEKVSAGQKLGEVEEHHVHVAFAASGIKTKQQAIDVFGESHVAGAYDAVGKYEGESIFAILYAESSIPSLNIACLFDENFIKSRTKSNEVYAQHSVVTTPFVACDAYEMARKSGTLFDGEFSIS